ncbi:unnamed protein product [Clavelina lepadiformis]|uniref:Uncharacterized protein n=1 Tax=Clavelina lepadiformis TaxID=159417 RepID=A0ABP0H1Q2_CLALP
MHVWFQSVVDVTNSSSSPGSHRQRENGSRRSHRQQDNWNSLKEMKIKFIIGYAFGIGLVLFGVALMILYFVLKNFRNCLVPSLTLIAMGIASLAFGEFFRSKLRQKRPQNCHGVSSVCVHSIPAIEDEPPPYCVGTFADHGSSLPVGDINHVNTYYGRRENSLFVDNSERRCLRLESSTVTDILPSYEEAIKAEGNSTMK